MRGPEQVAATCNVDAGSIREAARVYATAKGSISLRGVLGSPTAPTDFVRRLVNEVINGGDLDMLDELCTPSLAPNLRRSFSEFRSAFPDWNQRGREFVTDGHTVVARMRCVGTHQGEWQGLAPTGRPMRVDEV